MRPAGSVLPLAAKEESGTDGSESEVQGRIEPTGRARGFTDANACNGTDGRRSSAAPGELAGRYGQRNFRVLGDFRSR